MPSPKAIIFDLGGVLLDLHMPRCLQAFTRLGIPNLQEHFNLKHASHIFQDLETGAVTSQQFYDYLNGIVGRPVSSTHWDQAWNALLGQYRTESLEWIRSIKPHFRIFLLSNTNHIHHEGFQQIYRQQGLGESLDERFHQAYYSQNMGLRKPDPRIYEQVLRDHQLTAADTLFVDDNRQNVVAALQVGLQAYQLKADERVEVVLPEVFGM